MTFNELLTRYDDVYISDILEVYYQCGYQSNCSVSL